MFRYTFTLGIGYANANHEETMTYETEPSKNELESDWKEWSSNYIDGSYEKKEEDANSGTD